ncbi:leucine-rich repeat domain-containing protein [Dactylosporangium cerinum]
MVDDVPDIACPVLAVPAVPQADLADLSPLLRRLADPEPVRGTERFPLGTLQPDGRVDLCKQGLGAAGVAQVLDRVVGSPHAVHLLLGTNGLGATGTAALASGLPDGHRVETLYLGCNAIDAVGAALCSSGSPPTTGCGRCGSSATPSATRAWPRSRRRCAATPPSTPSTWSTRD